MKTINSMQKELAELKARLATVSNQSTTHKQLAQRYRTLSREYASLLIETGVPPVGAEDFEPPGLYIDEAPHTYPCWYVNGVPSKAGRPLAETWMRERGLQWDGNAPSLRREVVAALKRGDSVPNFGLSINLSTVHFE
jgi:hypothetical protein